MADVRHRLHHIRKRPKDWRRFFADANHDDPHPEGIDLARSLAQSHDIVFLTGRPQDLYDETTEWLDRHGLGGHRLVMRPAGDRRPAARVKVELLRKLAVERDVAVVVDDDPLVIDAMGAAGYQTHHAGWEERRPDSDAALRVAQEVEGRT